MDMFATKNEEKETITKKRKRRKITKTLFSSLKSAVVEKDVEAAYKAAFEKIYSGSISSPNGTDGLLRHKDISVAMEFKYDLNLRSSLDQATVLIQVIFYLKKLDSQGQSLPKVVFIGDVNECFCVPTSELTSYFKEDIDWSVAPSLASKMNPELTSTIAGNEDIRPFVYDVSKNFDFAMVVEKMKKISQGKPYAITITKKNIVEIFRRFEKDVVTDKHYTEPQVVDQKDEMDRMSKFVDLFFTCLTCPDEVYLHPKRRNEIVVRDARVRVNSAQYRAFFSEFRQEYTPRELEGLTANKDRILEDIHRRRTGAFFTPDIWVEEAHKMIAESFGDNWKDEYVVWDCACGTANLTRNYKFKELYLSTIDESDINTIKDCKYNVDATIFRYDFLASMGLENLPEKLKEAFRTGKKILFFINPPYGTSKHYDIDKGTSKTGIAKNKINEEMLKRKLGFSARQLYCHFIFKIAHIQKQHPGKISLGIFAPTSFLAADSYIKFNRFFQKSITYNSGIIFNARHFADVKGFWGISFTTWNPVIV